MLTLILCIFSKFPLIGSVAEDFFKTKVSSDLQGDEWRTDALGRICRIGRRILAGDPVSSEALANVILIYDVVEEHQYSLSSKESVEDRLVRLTAWSRVFGRALESGGETFGV